MKTAIIVFLSLVSSLHAEPESPTPHVVKIISGLEKPTCMTAPAKSTDYFYILEKPGKIILFDRETNKLREKPFMDLTDRVGSKANEQGLLCIAFSPNFPEDHRFYLYYTDKNGDTVISRCTAKGEDNISEEPILSFKQDFGNHNGGWLGFGPDGLLYIATGDGGSANDPKARAQDPNSMLGKLLRIDVTSGLLIVASKTLFILKILSVLDAVGFV